MGGGGGGGARAKPAPATHVRTKVTATLCFSKPGKQAPSICRSALVWEGMCQGPASICGILGLKTRGSEGEAQSAVLLITVVDQAQLSNHRYRVLEVGQVELGDGIKAL